MTKKAQELKVLLSSPKKIVITTHKGPDGDAIGSSLGLLHLLKQLGHKVQIITPNEYAEFLHWLPGNSDIITYDGNEVKANKITNEAELIFLLDFSHISRIADFADTVSNSNATKILIDHHQDPDDFANFQLLDTSASSTCQLIYDFICKSKLINFKIIFPIILLVIGMAISFGLTKIYGAKFAFLSVGVILGCIMFFNVFL